MVARRPQEAFGTKQNPDFGQHRKHTLTPVTHRTGGDHSCHDQKLDGKQCPKEPGSIARGFLANARRLAKIE
jgi:hypothetical protein